MLSVCIPVYNSDVTDLVNSLLHQINAMDYQVEICLIDDASPQMKCDISNFKHPFVITYKNSKNVGRAKIRNQFKELAQYAHLLFLDGDSRIIRNDFLKRYCEIISTSKIQVLCGASVYQFNKPPRTHYLRWKYSTHRESKSLEERQRQPNLGFKTNNFIIHREIFEQVNFNEVLSGYGHEDSLFGYDLNEAKIKIEHIDNPVLNDQLDDNITFLKKTQEGVANLIQVLQIVQYDSQFLKTSNLARTFISIKKSKLKWLIYFGLWVVHPVNKFLLERGLFVLPMFDIYKLKCMVSLGDQK